MLSFFKKLTKLRLYIIGGIVASLIALYFYLFRRDLIKDFWKKLKKDNYEDLFNLYDYITMMTPDKDAHWIANIFRLIENAQRTYFLLSDSDTKKFQDYLEKSGLEILDNAHIITFVLHTSLSKLIKIESKVMTFGAHLAVDKIIFPDGDFIYESYYRESIKEDGSSENPPKKKRARRRDDHSEYYMYAAPKSFDLQSKVEMFWNLHPEGVYIHTHTEEDNEETAEGSNKKNAFVIEDFKNPEYTIYGKNLQRVEDFSKRLQTFRDNAIQRSYLLIGRAGTGKSTFCLEIAKHLGGRRVIKISAELFAQFRRQDLDFILQYLKPHFVVIDDFDRVYSDYSPKSEDILYFFESLKNHTNSHMTVFCTVNSMDKMGEAIIRPGRFDEILVFNLPKADERLDLVKSFLGNLNVTTDENTMYKLVAVTEGFSHAYIKEYCLELKFDPDLESLIKRIAITKQFVRSDDFDDGSSFDIKDIEKTINKLTKKIKENPTGESFEDEEEEETIEAVEEDSEESSIELSNVPSEKPVDPEERDEYCEEDDLAYEAEEESPKESRKIEFKCKCKACEKERLFKKE